MNIEGTIFKIKRYALHDGPGIRTTVFFKGCPLTCTWCHNPEGIDPHPQTLRRKTTTGAVDETVGRRVGVDDLIREIEKDQLFYDESGGGVTLSGGEPLAQPDFLAALLGQLARREIHTTLDTSGFAPAAVVARVLPLVRLVLFDLKIMDPNAHRQHTGVTNQRILDNLPTIARSGVPVRIRVPLIPGMTDDDANLSAIAGFVGGLKTIRHIDLLPFHRIGDGKQRQLGLPDRMPGAQPPTHQRVERAAARFAAAGFSVTIGG
jgi:pyruvate formate lyase activating enzyme